LQAEKNNKEILMPEFPWDVNESHRKSLWEWIIFHNYLKSKCMFGELREDGVVQVSILIANSLNLLKYFLSRKHESMKTRKCSWFFRDFFISCFRD